MLIQEYINGRLKGDELILFEKNIEQDPLLAQEVDLARQVTRSVQKAQKLDIQAMLGDIAAQNPLVPDYTPIEETPPTPSVSGQKWWFVGLGIAVVLLAIVAIFWQQSGQRTERLQNIAKDYWTFDRAVNIDPVDNSDFANGIRFYDEKEFGKAATLFEKHLAAQENPDEDPIAQLYYGVSLALSQQQIKAIPLLVRLANQQTAVSSSAQWFLALCYLRDGNETQARKWLEGLKTDPVHGQRARNVLDALGK